MQGFSFADVRARIDRDIANKIFNITYLIDEGARVYVERINITGNDKTRDFVIRRELDFAEGDPFNRSLLTRGKTKIERLGFFGSVDVSTSQGSAADKVVIDIAVVEKSTGDYGFVAGYSSTDGILGEVSLTESNFLGRGQYMKVALGASQTGRNYTFSFNEPHFAGLNIATGFDAYKVIIDEDKAYFYGSDTTGAQLSFTLPVADNITASVFGGGKYTLYKDTNGDSALVVDGASRMEAMVGYSLTYSALNNTQKPTSGLAASFTQKYSGWDNNYVSTVAKVRYYMPMFEDERVVASVKGQAGLLTDFSGAGVDGTETFRLGSQLVRGFQQNGMGPRAATGEALGATYYAGLSAEVEFPVPGVPENYGLSTSIWGDVGYVGDTSAAAKAKAGGVAKGMTQQLRSSIGASVIWDSPFGPLRGDFAYVLQKDAGDRTQLFSIAMKSIF
jgi:outer membrane protein insertion porin family